MGARAGPSARRRRLPRSPHRAALLFLALNAALVIRYSRFSPWTSMSTTSNLGDSTPMGVSGRASATSARCHDTVTPPL